MMSRKRTRPSNEEGASFNARKKSKFSHGIAAVAGIAFPSIIKTFTNDQWHTQLEQYCMMLIKIKNRVSISHTTIATAASSPWTHSLSLMYHAVSLLRIFDLENKKIAWKRVVVPLCTIFYKMICLYPPTSVVYHFGHIGFQTFVKASEALFDICDNNTDDGGNGNKSDIKNAFGFSETNKNSETLLDLFWWLCRTKKELT